MVLYAGFSRLNRLGRLSIHPHTRFLFLQIGFPPIDPLAGMNNYALELTGFSDEHDFLLEEDPGWIIHQHLRRFQIKRLAGSRIGKLPRLNDDFLVGGVLVA